MKGLFDWINKWIKREKPNIVYAKIIGDCETQYLIEVSYEDGTDTVERVEKESERYKELQKWMPQEKYKAKTTFYYGLSESKDSPPKEFFEILPTPTKKYPFLWSKIVHIYEDGSKKEYIELCKRKCDTSYRIEHGIK